MKYSKSFSTAFILLALIQNLSQAQVKISINNVKYDFGIKQGLNVPYIHNSATLTRSQGDRPGFHFGAYASIRTGKLAIQPEIIFSRQQHTYSFLVDYWVYDPAISQHATTLASIPLNFATNFDYINLPIIFKYYLKGGFNLQAGPQFSWLVNGANLIAVNDYVSTQQGNVYLNSPKLQKMSDFIRPSDIAVAVGFGWGLPCGLNVTSRYNMGLIDMNKQSTLGYADVESPFATREAKNHVLQISFGYRLFRFEK